MSQPNCDVTMAATVAVFIKKPFSNCCISASCLQLKMQENSIFVENENTVQDVFAENVFKNFMLTVKTDLLMWVAAATHPWLVVAVPVVT